MGLCQTEELEGLVLVYERVHCGSLYAFLHHKVSLLPVQSINPHVCLMMLVSVLSNCVLCSTFISQVLLPCIRQLLHVCHIFLLSQLTTFTIHNSLSLSLPAQDLPFSQIFPTIDSLPASGLTPGLYDWSVSSEHFGVFLVFFISLFCCGSVRQIKLGMC